MSSKESSAINNRGRRPNTLRVFAAASAMALALAGCAPETSTDPGDSFPVVQTDPTAANPTPEATATPTPTPEARGPYAVKPCATGPINVPKPDTNRTQIILTQDPVTKRATTDPGPLPPDILRHVEGALVKISDANGYGSGFLVRGNLVVSAAHVPDQNDFRNDVVADRSGRTAHFVDVCDISLGPDGQPVDPESHDVRVIDISVGRLDHALGSSTLTLAQGPAQRGDWVTYVNAQHTRGREGDPQDPSVYNALALGNNADGPAYLTGISPTDSEPTKYSAMGGSSGGIGVNRKGEVVVESFASSQAAEDPHDVARTDGVILIQPPDTELSDMGWFPDTSYGVNPDTMRRAVVAIS